MKNKTQLQLRIELSVKNNKSYPINSCFIDTYNYEYRNFLNNNNNPYNNFLSENDIKTAKNYSDIKPSI